MPKVSAIITTFNRADYLKKAIESVLNQTFTDFELLILDNSSTDNTESVVKSLGDNRLRYIKHKPLGISQARNLAVRESTGKFISFLDDDDIWLPCKLEKQLEVFERGDKDLSLVYGGFVKINAAGKKVGIHKPVLRGNILRELLWQKDDFTGSASNPMIKKSVIDNLGGYDEQVTTGEDWELYLRLAEKDKIDFTSEFVALIRTHSGPRLGDKLEETAQLEIKVLQRYGYIFDTAKRLKSFYNQKLGGKYIRIGQVGKGRAYILNAIRLNPINVVAYFQLFLSLLGKDFYCSVHKAYSVFRKKSILIKLP